MTLMTLQLPVNYFGYTQQHIDAVQYHANDTLLYH